MDMHARESCHAAAQLFSFCTQVGLVALSIRKYDSLWTVVRHCTTSFGWLLAQLPDLRPTQDLKLGTAKLAPTLSPAVHLIAVHHLRCPAELQLTVNLH